MCDRFNLTGPASGPVERSWRRGLLRSTRLDITVALSVAAVVNLSLVVVAAAGFPGQGIDSIEGAYTGIASALGTASAVMFALALLASGLASSSVGAYSGAVVVEGFAGRCIAPALRRLMTVVPALAVVATGVDPTTALVLSQVVLSFGVPFALWPLVVLTRDRAVMGELVNRRTTHVLAVFAATAISALNLGLLALLVL